MRRGNEMWLRLPKLPSLRWTGLWAFALAIALPAQAQEMGRIEGRVLGADGKGVEGVVVQVENPEVGAFEVTDRRGGFVLDPVPVGDQTLIFSLGEDTATQPVEVPATGAAHVEQTVDWSLSVADTLTVFAASRRRERIVDAPAPVSTLSESEILRQAPTGQIPKLFESLPGAELTQSGLYDFKFNARGANISVNRRVAVLIDGRDPSFPFLGSQEWAAAAFPMDDVATAELVRGPSSALYGANAFNGVLDLTTKTPRYSQGGVARLTAGELSTLRGEVRHAGQASDNLFYKVLASYTESDDFYKSRNASVEYTVPCVPGVVTRDCLATEAVPLSLDRDKIAIASGRLDRYFENGSSLTGEVGTAEIEGYVLSAPGSRFQTQDLSRPWARANFNSPRWNALLTYTTRDVEALTLSSGTLSFLDTFRAGLEIQGNWTFNQGRSRVVAGVYAGHEDIDSADPNGVQSLLPEVKTDDLRAFFGQVDFDLGEKTKLVVAGRIDDSKFYDPEFSPKVALVWSPKQNHSVRFGYNQGFLRPNYPEYFVRVPIFPSVDLSLLEGLFCAPVGVACGFDQPVNLIVVGNDKLVLETIRGFEIGYKAIVANRGLLTIDAYATRIEDFVQQFVPQLGTRLGRANPAFGPYAPPAELPQPLADTLVATLQSPLLGPLAGFFPFLSNENGRPVYVLSTSINFGTVESQGVEIALDFPINDRWTLNTNYSWFDFNVKDEIPEAPLEPNGPENKANLGLSYSKDRFGASIFARWADDFPWAEGVLIGTVPSYTVVNLAAAYDVNDTVEVGLNVSNALDDRHYELFGGDILERRALGYVSYSW